MQNHDEPHDELHDEPHDELHDEPHDEHHEEHHVWQMQASCSSVSVLRMPGESRAPSTGSGSVHGPSCGGKQGL